MKFVAFRRKCAHRPSQLDELPPTALESLTKRCGVPHQAHTYSELRQQIHDDLRIQHPEWIQPTGECPLCDAYEARLMELLDPLGSKADDQSAAAPEHGLN